MQALDAVNGMGMYKTLVHQSIKTASPTGQHSTFMPFDTAMARIWVTLDTSTLMRSGMHFCTSSVTDNDGVASAHAFRSCK
jgi:hypothetical protein